MDPIKPTAYDVESLEVGFLAPDCFGTLSRVTRIYARGVNVKSKPYVCYYTRLSDTSTVSGSMTVGEVYPSLPVIAECNQTSMIPDRACTTLLIAANGGGGYEHD